MLLTLETFLDTDAKTAWRLIKRTSTFLYVARGLLRLMKTDELPEEWQEGQAIRTRLLLLNWIPAWRHELQVLSVNDDRREIKTQERSGPLTTWNHTLSVEPLDDRRCRYRDTLEFSAGWLTWLAWPSVQAFFRYRQMRLRRLARNSSKNPPPASADGVAG